MIGITLFVIAALIIVIWVTIELKRLKHKIFAMILIAVILFVYLSAFMVFRGQDVDFKTVPGLIDGSKLYFSWMVSVSGNFVTITTNAIKMDWSSENNQTKSS